MKQCMDSDNLHRRLKKIIGQVQACLLYTSEGEAMVNQSSMTGESMPIVKREGSFVYAGTVCEEGECVFRVEKTMGGGRYDRIVKMIEQSEKLKSTAEDKASRLADKLVPYTPVSYTHLLFKTAASLEETGRIQIVALDKTGTITSGEPAVTDVLPAAGVAEQELFRLAVSLEQKSEHPLSKAILKRAEAVSYTHLDVYKRQTSNSPLVISPLLIRAKYFL